MSDSTTFANPRAIHMDPSGYGIASYQDNNRLNVNFYTKSVNDPQKSMAAGMPINVDKVYVKMHHPGEMLNVIDRPAKQQDTHQYPSQWQHYLHNRTQVPEGTPIEMLFPNNPSIADNLRIQGIHTVQQCANLTSTAIDSIGIGGQEYVNRAKKYIQNASDGTEVLKLIEEGKKKDLQIDRLNMDLNTLRDQVRVLMAERGSPHASLMNPVDIKGVDVQAQRINNAHTSGQIASGQIYDPLKPVALADMVQSDGTLAAPTIFAAPTNPPMAVTNPSAEIDISALESLEPLDIGIGQNGDILPAKRKKK